MWHHDHHITGRGTLDAIFLYVRDLFSYPDLLEEGLQPHKVKEVLLCGTEEPNYHANITDTFDLKIAALRCHKSQISDNPSSGLEGRMRGRHKMLAQKEDFELAEAFYRLELRLKPEHIATQAAIMRLRGKDTKLVFLPP